MECKKLLLVGDARTLILVICGSNQLWENALTLELKDRKFDNRCKRMAMIIDTESEESNMPLKRSIRYCSTAGFDSEVKMSC